MLGEALGIGDRRRVVDQAAESSLESAADGGEPVLAQLAGVASVSGGEAGLQHRLDLLAAGTLGVDLLQRLAALQEVIDAGLGGARVAAIHDPPVADEHAGVVGPEYGGRVVEPAAGTDGVDGGLWGSEGPQPVGYGVGAPAGFVRDDDRSGADLLAEFVIDRHAGAGGAMQHLDEAAGGDRHAEGVPQHASDLLERDAEFGVPLDGGGDDVGAELQASVTVGAVADLDVQASHEGLHLGGSS